MILVRRFVMAVLMVALVGAGLVIGAKPAGADSYGAHLEPGWNLWTKEYCQDGRLKYWRRLTDGGGDRQGRLYVYVRNRRLCAYTVDHMRGAHDIYMFAKRRGSWKYSMDQGHYNRYAGALAAPRRVGCIKTEGWLLLGGPTYDRRAIVCK